MEGEEVLVLFLHRPIQKGTNMTRVMCTMLALLFLVACGGGGTQPTTPEHIQDQIEDIIQADPVFLGSHPLIIYENGNTEELSPLRV